jgi:hypothetical protein
MRKIPEKLTKRERKPRWNWAKHAVRRYKYLIEKNVIYKVDPKDGHPELYFIIRDIDENYEYFFLEVLNCSQGTILTLKVGSLIFKTNYLWPSHRIFSKKEITKAILKGISI